MKCGLGCSALSVNNLWPTETQGLKVASKWVNCSFNQTFHSGDPELFFTTPCQLLHAVLTQGRVHEKVKVYFHSMHYQGKVLSED
jgi:hypothetical protein